MHATKYSQTLVHIITTIKVCKDTDGSYNYLAIPVYQVAIECITKLLMITDNIYICTLLPIATI